MSAISARIEIDISSLTLREVWAVIQTSLKEKIAQMVMVKEYKLIYNCV